MILPIGDAPNPRGTPWATWLLLALNALVYLALAPLAFERPAPDDPALVEYVATIARDRGLDARDRAALAAQTTRYDLVLWEHGYRPTVPSPARLLTSMFLHGGLLHLLGNLLFLWIFGDNVEHRLGRPWFLVVYLLTGAAATLGDAALRAGSEVPTVGASGAISGVLGAYFVWFPKNRVHLLVVLFPFLVTTVEVPARFMLGVYVLIDNLLPLLLAGSEGGVAHGAHLGGFFAGAALGLVADALGAVGAAARAVDAPDASPGAPAGWTPAPGLGPWAAGGPEAAGRALARTPRAQVRALPPADVLDLARALEGRDPATALALHRRVVEVAREPRVRAAAHLGAARVLAPVQPTLAYQHLARALEEDPGGPVAGEARALLEALARGARRFPRRPGG